MARKRVALRVAAMIMVIANVISWFFHGAAPAELTGTVIIILLIAYEIWWQGWLRKRKRTKQLAKTFELRIHTNRIAVLSDPHGSVPVRVMIAVRYTTPIDHFNIRFVASESGGNVPPTTISIDSVSYGPGFSGFHGTPDPEGGVDCRYNAGALNVHAGKDVELILNVKPYVSWSGYLSFQGWDADDNRRYSRQPFVVEGSGGTR